MLISGKGSATGSGDETFRGGNDFFEIGSGILWCSGSPNCKGEGQGIAQGRGNQIFSGDGKQKEEDTFYKDNKCDWGNRCGAVSNYLFGDFYDYGTGAGDNFFIL